MGNDHEAMEWGDYIGGGNIRISIKRDFAKCDRCGAILYNLNGKIVLSLYNPEKYWFGINEISCNEIIMINII
jgi:hypothetical protein